MPDRAAARAGLHGASCGILLFLLLPAVGRALSPLVIPLAEPVDALLVIAALAAPAIPLPHGSKRLVAAVAGGIAALAAGLSPKVLTDVLALAGGSLWLSLAPRYLAGRAITAGAAAAFAALPLHAVTPPGSAAASGLSLLAAALTAAALHWPVPAPPTPERRARAFRLRGLLALGALLYLDGVLRNPLADQPLIAAAAAAAGALAALVVALAPAPVPTSRRELLLFAALAIVAAAAVLLDLGSTVSTVAARALLVVLVARALVPAGGRRPRIQASAGWAVWAGAVACAGYLSSGLAFALAAALALACLALLPRAARWGDPAP